ncbi:3-hydroxyacyl-CoA dehydrogenase [Candidatus Thorarchaeota archaeon]|nr:3-hydroxyacyl-CoA dehydrogenase [Candidatus Thorarchaeota archaeon]TFG98230.1 MAG: 3-hydroxyacyl-CoA dehydrogenase [Candidatus Thorarchaeota archaeon]
MKVNKIAVIGAGLMGAGISYVSAASGYEVIMTDLDEAAINRGLSRIKYYVESGVKRGKLSPEDGEKIISRLATTTNLSKAVSDVDLVIEAVFENMDVKKKLFREMDRAAKPQTILASNTSSLSITELGKVTNRPDKVIGMHYFSPVPAMKLLEVIIGKDTTDDTVQTALEVGEKQRKITVKAIDSPGFIVNRLRAQISRAVLQIYEQGLASAEEIDTAMKEKFGTPMGSLELTDFVGLDVSLGTGSTLERELGDCYKVPEILKKYVEEGRIGRKAGKGFYAYEDDQKRSLEEPKGADPDWLVNRIIMPYLREAMIEFETGIASKDDIDKAMKLGSNYKEGPFETIERLGLDVVREELKKLQQEFGDCYSPPKMLH